MPREQAYLHVYVETDSEDYEPIEEILPENDRNVFSSLSTPIFMAVGLLFDHARVFLHSKGYFERPIISTMSPVEMVVVYLADALGNGEEVRQHCKIANQSWFYLHNWNSGARYFKRFNRYFETYKFLATAMGCEEEILAELENYKQLTVKMLDKMKNTDGTYGNRNWMFPF